MNLIFVEFTNGDIIFRLRIDHIIEMVGDENVVIYNYQDRPHQTTMTIQEVSQAIQNAMRSANQATNGIVVPRKDIDLSKLN